MKPLSVSKQRVFLRADLNVPLDNTTITDTTRLEAIRPTLDQLLANGNTVILATHIGRPQAHEQRNFFDPNLSTKLLLPWFTQQGYTIELERDLKAAATKSHQQQGGIILLENLRFFNGEKQADADFAHLLADCADVYINDAFALLHRPDASVTLLAELFDKSKRSFGLLVKKELAALEKLKKNPAHPYVIVIGGNKVFSKSELLLSLLQQEQTLRPDTILLGGALAFSFLSHAPTNTEIDERDKALAHDIQAQAKSAGVNLVLPTDHVSVDGSAIDIGEQTVRNFCEHLASAQTIFAAGPLGKYEDEAGRAGTTKVYTAIAQSNAHGVIGGGDGAAAAKKAGLEDQIDFISTGGGATLAVLACRSLDELPAYHSMKEGSIQ